METILQSSLVASLGFGQNFPFFKGHDDEGLEWLLSRILRFGKMVSSGTAK